MNMNFDRLNRKLTREIIDIFETFDFFYGVRKTQDGWTYHHETGCEVFDVDFWLEIDTEKGLVIKAVKSFDKEPTTGGKYSEDSQITLTPHALGGWFENNNIPCKETVKIAQKLLLIINNVYNWADFEKHFYTTLYDMYNESDFTFDAIEYILKNEHICTEGKRCLYNTMCLVQLNEECCP